MQGAAGGTGRARCLSVGASQLQSRRRHVCPQRRPHRQVHAHEIRKGILTKLFRFHSMSLPQAIWHTMLLVSQLHVLPVVCCLFVHSDK